MELFELPAYGCEIAEHQLLWYHDDFGMELSEALLYDGVFPYPRSGFLGVKCRRCGERLKNAHRGSIRIEQAFTISEVPGARAVIHAHGVRCAACGEQHLDDGRAAKLALGNAMAKAFESVKLLQ